MLAGALPTLQLAEEGGGRLVRTYRGAGGGLGCGGVCLGAAAAPAVLGPALQPGIS